MKWLKVTGILTLTAVLASGLTACGSPKTKTGYAKQIVLFNWSEYMPQSVLTGFQKKYGISVKRPTYSSNEIMYAKLVAGSAKLYDMAVPSNFFIQKMIQKDLLQKIDKSKIPNLKNISPAFLGRSWDKSNQYSIPYLSSPTTIVENTKTCPVTIKTFNDLINPKLKNSIVCGLDEKGLVGLGLRALGYSGQSRSKNQIYAAENWLKKLTPNIKAYDPDSPKIEMLSNEASVGLMWSGDSALSIDGNPGIRLVWPNNKGIFISVDNFVILKSSTHKRECELFINYVLSGKVSAQTSKSYPYLNPNLAAKKYFSKKYLTNPAVNISSKYINSAEWAEDVGSAQQYYDKVYNEIKT